MGKQSGSAPAQGFAERPGGENGDSVEVELTPKKDAIIVKPTQARSQVRGRHRIEDLVAAMPKGYKAAEFDWGTEGREVW